MHQLLDLLSYGSQGPRSSDCQEDHSTGNCHGLQRAVIALLEQSQSSHPQYLLHSLFLPKYTLKILEKGNVFCGGEDQTEIHLVHSLLTEESLLKYLIIALEK